VKVTVFDTHNFERLELQKANQEQHELLFLETRLSAATVSLASGSEAICCFVNDCVDKVVLTGLKKLGVGLVVIRGAGYNNVDLLAARELKISVLRVPQYSPHAVAEYAVALLLTLNRKTHKAFNRTHELNFSLEGLVGFDLFGKTVGVVGTGRIGRVFAKIMKGFDCHVLTTDLAPDLAWAAEIGVNYTDLPTLISQSDVISLHLPLTPATRHLITGSTFAQMKSTALLINTGRGGLIETAALIKALKTGKIGGACLDVYEEEEGVFFSDLSQEGIKDDLLARLITFPNVIVTSHQAFLTHEALANIAQTTIENLNCFAQGTASENQIG
jgi:D-lactate dehydrogenase